VKQDLFVSLRSQDLLENFSGHLKPPQTLLFVPLDFCDDEGVPITLTSLSAEFYLSQRYVTADKDALLRLGVTEMTVEAFVQQVQDMISNDPDDFRSRSPGWHATLAAVLEQRGRHARNKDLLLTLDVIPLRDGSWIAGIHGNTYFPGDSTGFSIPGGLTCNIVHEEAAYNNHRRMLFHYLGVKEIDSKHFITTNCLPQLT
jgi:hypothetical protein